MFDRDDEKFAAQLRQFRPQSPRSLPNIAVRPRNRRVIQIAMFAVAAIILLAIVPFIATRKTPVLVKPLATQAASEPVTLGQLRRFTDDPAQLDSRLASMSTVLPDVHREGGVLKKLAQETR